MTRRTARLRRLGGERGVVAVIVAMCMVLLLGVTAVAIDLGYTYLQQRRLQSAVDFAVLAGAHDLMTAPNSAAGDATTFLDNNWQQNGNATNPNASLVTCPFSPTNPQQGCGSSSATCPSNTPCQIHVSASAPVPTIFGKIFGISSINVSAQGSACGGCNEAVQKYDVMIVMDRSFSMCLNSSGYDDCTAIQAAKQGVLSLLQNVFNAQNDNVGLTLLSPADAQNIDHWTGCLSGTSCTCGTSGNPCNPPCDTINTSDYDSSGNGNFYGTLGDFMRGDSNTTAGTWVVAPLSNTYQNADGSLNNGSPLVSTLNCMQAKWWTPMAPAIQAATNALNADTTPGVKKIMIYEGDGGGDAQPMPISANGTPTTSVSTPKTSAQTGYTPLVTSENGVAGVYPCEDAVAQAQRAKANNITIYTIGYNLGASGADNCYDNNAYPNDVDSQSATTTLTDIASTPSDFYQAPTETQLKSIFSTIGQQIVDSSTRLTG